MNQEWPQQVYLIERAWTDSMENELSAALGYEAVGFVYDEQRAKELCAKGRTLTERDCWAIRGSIPELRYRSLDVVVSEADMRKEGIRFGWWTAREAQR